MFPFKKKKASKSDKIIVDHGHNDIRVYSVPGEMLNMQIKKDEEENKDYNKTELNKMYDK